MTAAISFWVAQIIGNSMGTMLALCLLCHPLACLPAAVFLLLQVAIVVLPVGEAPVLIQRAIHFSVQSALSYFSCRVTVEDADALKPGQAYVVGLEPHSALPVALPMVFTDHCDLLPKGLRGIKILAHTAALYMPATRHFWWWLGVRPIDKANIHKLLAANNSVVLVPGGVSECMVMKQGQEVMYLRKRLGFVRLALNHGAPLVPAFAFGQSDTYSWIRPGPQYVVDFFRRVLGFVPLLMWGIWYSAVPYKVPVHVVIGTPVLLPQMDNPTDEEVQQYLDMYITAMENLCKRYKHETGHAEMQFQVV
ncbi:hypothetical protein WJX79_001880 [Trebouxia sp. C0005]